MKDSYLQDALGLLTIRHGLLQGLLTAEETEESTMNLIHDSPVVPLISALVSLNYSLLVPFCERVGVTYDYFLAEIEEEVLSGKGDIPRQPLSEAVGLLRIRGHEEAGRLSLDDYVSTLLSYNQEESKLEVLGALILLGTDILSIYSEVSKRSEEEILRDIEATIIASRGASEGESEDSF